MSEFSSESNNHFCQLDAVSIADKHHDQVFFAPFSHLHFMSPRGVETFNLRRPFFFWETSVLSLPWSSIFIASTWTRMKISPRRQKTFWLKKNLFFASARQPLSSPWSFFFPSSEKNSWWTLNEIFCEDKVTVEWNIVSSSPSRLIFHTVDIPENKSSKISFWKRLWSFNLLKVLFS